MKYFLIIILLFSKAFAQVQDNKVVYLTDGLYAKDSVTIGIQNSSIVTSKLKTPPRTTYEYKIVVGDGYNKKFEFTNVPKDYSDYQVYRGKYIMWPRTDYVTEGNVITVLVKCYSGNRITYWRLK